MKKLLSRTSIRSNLHCLIKRRSTPKEKFPMIQKYILINIYFVFLDIYTIIKNEIDLTKDQSLQFHLGQLLQNVPNHPKNELPATNYHHGIVRSWKNCFDKIFSRSCFPAYIYLL